LIANKAQFHDSFGLNGAQIEGSAYFNEAKFLYPIADPSTVDFRFVHVRGSFECYEAVFRGSARFSFLNCDVGMFQGACFSHPHAEISFRGASFEKHFGFSGNNYQTTFMGKVDLTELEVRGAAEFNHVRFGSSIYPIDFTDSSFTGRLDFSDSSFAGPVLFCGITCARDADFTRALFEGRTATTHTMGTLPYQTDSTSDAELQDGVRGKPALGQTPVRVGVDFRYAIFEGELRLEGVRCHDTIDLGQTLVKRKLHLQDAQFWGETRLYDARIGTIVVWSRGTAIAKKTARNCWPFCPASLDLVGCCFDQFHGGPIGVEQELAWLLVNNQKADRFSRDPYLQLEKFYRNSGNTGHADDIIYQSHKAQLANARNPMGATKWPWWRLGWERLLWWTTGWGLKLHWMLGWTLLLWILVTVLFIFQDGLVRHSQLTTERVATLTTNLGSILVERPDSRGVLLSDTEAAWFSLDLLLPVDLGFDKRWEPSTWFARFVMVGLAVWQAFVIGALLLPYLNKLFQKKE
jgi:hypothetical protein